MVAARAQPLLRSPQPTAGSSRGPGDELAVGTSRRNGQSNGAGRKRIVVDLTFTDSDDDDDLNHDEGSDFETLVKPPPATAPKAPLKAVLVRRSPAQVPRTGAASLSPYPNPLPLLRPAIEEFDTPVRKRAHSPEPHAAQKRARAPDSTVAEPPREQHDSLAHLPSTPLTRNVTRSENASPEPVNKVIAEPSTSTPEDARVERDDEGGTASGKSTVQQGAVDSRSSAAAVPGSAKPAPDGAALIREVNTLMAPPPVPTPAPSPVRSRVAGPSSSRRRQVQHRLFADRHICRPPPTPPSLPNLVNPTCLADLLVHTPSLPVIRPNARFDPSSTSRLSESIGSPELGVARASSTASSTSPSLGADASPRRRRRTPGFVESSEDYWAHLLPNLSDCPHVGDDIAYNNRAQDERHYRPGLEPIALPLRSGPVDFWDRSLDDPVLLDVENSAALMRAASLPDARGLEAASEMTRQEREARRAARRARRARRAGRQAVSGASSSAGEGEGVGGGRRKVERSRASRASLQRETEGELQDRLRRLDLVLQLDDPGSATDSGATSSTGSSGDVGDDDEPGVSGRGGARARAAAPRPTLGFRALALRVQAGYRAKRRARQAEGRDLDESTDEEGG
ncbi:hypothetical protein JCM8208_002905 [Rhodotorula glutinis]